MYLRQTREVNWLLTGFILVSVVAHGILLLHVSGIYNSRTISYIELSMQSVSQPNTRRLPTPRSRRIPEPKTLATPSSALPTPRPVTVPPPLPPPQLNQVDLPELPDQLNMGQYQVANLAPAPVPAAPQGPTGGEVIQFATAREYFELLNLRINQMKTYPEMARSRHLQGRVKVEFVLGPNGQVSQVKLLKKCRHADLNQAALEAVGKAAPFPVPPARLLKTPVKLRVSILFELT